MNKNHIKYTKCIYQTKLCSKNFVSIKIYYIFAQNSDAGHERGKNKQYATKIRDWPSLNLIANNFLIINIMSKVKSYSVGEGDMFYIDHNSDNFTIIDCCLNKKDGVKETILNEIVKLKNDNGISRFISTHPDDDHISGLKELNDKIDILNFYRVNNETTKKDKSDDFDCYCNLRDDSKISFELKKGCSRRWMNLSDEKRGSSGLFCLWPETSNEKYKKALQDAKNGKKPNNISPAIRYVANPFSFLWMGDMENDMQTEFESVVGDDIPITTVVFAPHHGRDSGKMPKALLKRLNPKLIVIGEAPSDDLNYYSGYNTITQNSAGDIYFDVEKDYTHVYVSENSYNKTNGMVQVKSAPTVTGMKYLGSIKA